MELAPIPTINCDQVKRCMKWVRIPATARREGASIFFDGYQIEFIRECDAETVMTHLQRHPYLDIEIPST